MQGLVPGGSSEENIGKFHDVVMILNEMRKNLRELAADVKAIKEDLIGKERG